MNPVNAGLSTLGAILVLAGCATEKQPATGTAAVYQPDYVARTPTVEATDYSGTLIRVRDGQKYYCRQRYIRFADYDYQKREVCFNPTSYWALLGVVYTGWGDYP